MDNSEALSNAVCDVLDEKVKFDNDFIVNYTKEHYAQEEITKHILNIFEEAIPESNKENSYEEEK